MVTLGNIERFLLVTNQFPMIERNSFWQHPGSRGYTKYKRKKCKNTAQKIDHLPTTIISMVLTEIYITSYPRGLRWSKEWIPYCNPLHQPCHIDVIHGEFQERGPLIGSKWCYRSKLYKQLTQFYKFQTHKRTCTCKLFNVI